MDNKNCDVKVATSIDQVIALAKLGYDCQPIGENRWLMRKSFKV